MKLLIFISALFMITCRKDPAATTIVTLGDSYTFCEGSTPDSCWVNLMAENLKKKKYSCELSANPAVNGFTTNDLINQELPVFRKIRPVVGILMIGTNDIFQGVDLKTLQTNYDFIVQEMQK